MKFLTRFIWGISTIVFAYLLLRIYTGVGRFDLGGYGLYVYPILLISYVFYSVILSKKFNIKWYWLVFLSLLIIILVVEIFFLSFWFEW